MLSTDLTKFIRSVPIALSLTDRNETERNERTKPNSDFEMNNRTTETSEWTYIYSGWVGKGMVGQGKGVWQERSKVGVGWVGARVGEGRCKG